MKRTTGRRTSLLLACLGLLSLIGLLGLVALAYAQTQPTLNFIPASYTVVESAGTVTVTVQLSQASSEPVTVAYTTSNGTAVSPGDYQAASGQLTFAAGQILRTFTVTIVEDLAAEGAETINLTLSSPINATLGPTSTGTITITDNDTPGAGTTVQFSSAEYSVDETAGTATITVTLTGMTGLTVSVSYATSDGTATAPADYAATSGTLTFSPGTTSRTFNVPIVNDNTFEAMETVSLELSNPANATLGAPSTATLTIVDDEPCP